MEASPAMLITRDDIFLGATVLSALTGLILLFLKLSERRAQERANQTEQEETTAAKLESPKDLVKEKIVGYIAAVLAAILFGVHHVMASELVETHGPLYTVASRNAVGGIIFIVFGFFLKRFRQGVSYNIFDANTLTVFIGATGANICYAMGLTTLSATAVAALYKLNPVYVFFLVLWFNPASFSRIRWYEALVSAVVVSTGAVIAVVGNLNANVSESLGFKTGIIWVLLAGIFWSFQNVFLERRDFEYGLKAAKLFYIGQILVMSSVLLLLVAIALGKIPEVKLLFTGTIVPLGIIFGTTLLLTFEAVNRIGALPTTAIASFEVLFAGIVEAVVKSIKITWNFLFGTALIILGNIGLSKQNQLLLQNPSEKHHKQE